MYKKCEEILNKLESEGKIKRSDFSFPPKQELKLKLKDMLEDNVDEKYFLSDKMIQYISATGTANFRNPDSKINLDIARPLTTDQNKRAGTTNYLSEDLPSNYNLNEVVRKYGIFDTEKSTHQAGSVYDENGLSPTLDTMQGGYRQPCIEIKEATKQGYKTAYEGDGVNISSRMKYQRGNVQKESIQTITTSGGNDRGVVVKDIRNMKEKLCDELVESGLLNDGTVINHSYTNGLCGKNKNSRQTLEDYIESNNGVIPCVTTRPDTMGIAVGGTKLQREVCNKAIEKNLVEPNDVIEYTYSNARLKELDNNTIRKQNKADNQIMSTLVTKPDKLGVVVKSVYSDLEEQLFTKDGNIKRYIDSDIVDEFKDGQMATTSFPNGYGHGPRTHDESICLNCIDKPSVKHNLRIRKLTPKEVWRLMGFDDEDFEKASKVNSNSQLYKQAGNSIVVNVLEAILNNLLNQK